MMNKIGTIKLSINGDSFGRSGTGRWSLFPWSWIEPYFDVYGKLDWKQKSFTFQMPTGKDMEMLK